MLPVALGLGEVSKFRTSMGIAILGGLILSTFLTLIVVPAMFEYIDTLREFIESKFRPKYKLAEPEVVEEIEEIEETEEIIKKEIITIQGNPGQKGKSVRNKKKAK
jgi:HAE1 family hydrophobic/amphiphilic exporter-1